MLVRTNRANKGWNDMMGMDGRSRSPLSTDSPFTLEVFIHKESQEVSNDFLITSVIDPG